MTGVPMGTTRRASDSRPASSGQVTVTATSVVEHHAYGGGGGTSGMYGYGGASGRGCPE